MTAKVKARPAEKTAYEADFSAWLYEQAALIRSGRFAELDVENVAEELEGMARSEFRSLKSALRVLVMHMLKWDHQPSRRSASWASSIVQQRLEFDDVLEDNPSLRPRQDEALRKAYRLARGEAARETDLPLREFPTECPYDWDALLKRRYRFESDVSR